MDPITLHNQNEKNNQYGSNFISFFLKKFCSLIVCCVVGYKSHTHHSNGVKVYAVWKFHFSSKTLIQFWISFVYTFIVIYREQNRIQNMQCWQLAAWHWWWQISDEKTTRNMKHHYFSVKTFNQASSFIWRWGLGK